jgi:hypothetical protein
MGGESMSGDMDVNGDLMPLDLVLPRHAELAPGETCSTCKRKVPHPRKESSPTSKTFAYRVPVDEAEAHAETLDVAARFVGVAEQPFFQYKLIALALVLVLQDENMRGFAQRAA